MTPLLVASNLGLPGRLQPTELSMNSGEMVALVGPNGSGKTSLLRCLAMVEGAIGDVAIDGELLSDVGPNRRNRLLAFLPASRELAWPICVRDLARLGVTHADAEREATIFAALELDGLLDRPVNALSTGERSRALIARILVASPRLVLLDEPLANLDPYWMRKLPTLFRSMIGDREAAAIMSLHDLSQLPRFDRVLVVADGAVAYDGAPNDFIESRQFEGIFRVTPGEAGLALS